MLTDKTLTTTLPYLVQIAQQAGQIATQTAGTLAANLGKSVAGVLSG
jgi:hypothetical protein